MVLEDTTAALALKMPRAIVRRGLLVTVVVMVVPFR